MNYYDAIVIRYDGKEIAKAEEIRKEYFNNKKK